MDRTNRLFGMLARCDFGRILCGCCAHLHHTLSATRRLYGIGSLICDVVRKFFFRLQTAELHDIDHEVLEPPEVQSRFPGYRLPDDFKVCAERHNLGVHNCVLRMDAGTAGTAGTATIDFRYFTPHVKNLSGDMNLVSSIINYCLEASILAEPV